MRVNQRGDTEPNPADGYPKGRWNPHYKAMLKNQKSYNNFGIIARKRVHDNSEVLEEGGAQDLYKNVDSASYHQDRAAAAWHSRDEP